MAVTGFAVLDNHLHVLVRLDPDVAKGWSDEDVVRRWGHLFPPQDRARQVAPVSEDWVQARLKDAKWIATARERLQSLSWFMKCLKLIDALESHGHLGYLFAALRRDRPEMNWPSGLATARDTSPAA